jgi:DNA-binding winged helix-turn-helix (wHTH) protein
VKIVPNLFLAAPAKARILAALAEAAPDIVAAPDLCEAVYGNTDARNRDSLRNLVAQMRPALRAVGYDILGRKELRMNAYCLIHTLLE